MRLGTFVTPPVAWPPSNETKDISAGTSMYSIALQWLAEDRGVRRELEITGRKKRGARRDAVREPMYIQGYV